MRYAASTQWPPAVGSDFDAVFHPDAVDRENKLQPPSSRVPRPAGFHSTALWLRAAFAGLHYEIHHALTDGDLVAVNSTMNGRHVAQFVLYRDDGEVDTAFPPTGKSFAMAQTHWFRIQGGKVIEHWAVRDDLGQAKQLGWLPPTPSVSGPDGVGKASGQALRPPRASTTA